MRPHFTKWQKKLDSFVVSIPTRKSLEYVNLRTVLVDHSVINVRSSIAIIHGLMSTSFYQKPVKRLKSTVRKCWLIMKK